MTDTYSTKERANIELVSKVYREVLGPLDSSAVQHYFVPGYIQHNPMAETGASGLEDFLDWARGTSPDATHEVKRIFADGDHVIAHVHVVIEPGSRGNNVIDIFRIEEGKIAEHWDAMQEIPHDPRNSNGVF